MYIKLLSMTRVKKTAMTETFSCIPYQDFHTVITLMNAQEIIAQELELHGIYR